MTANENTIQALLVRLYGEDVGRQTADRLRARLAAFEGETASTDRHTGRSFTEKDIVVITYADQLRRPSEPPLVTLREFFTQHLADVITIVHILPFYPYSSDDGFSVVDYTAVDPELGTWADIEQFDEEGFRLMFDAVINHISAQSEWFRAFKAGDPRYRDYFITVDPSAADLSRVIRPRALPLLTAVETAMGTQHVWTTFSADQIDLDFSNPDTLLDVIDVLLQYVKHGADIIRLDAIAYLWKEIGTSCIHLPQTHTVVKLLRALLDQVAPGTILITETNVPHEENVSYFGSGVDEAQMVYNFSLPPLVAHALLTGSATALSDWASQLETPSPHTWFFNFTASHDGIGVRPLAGLLSDAELDVLLERTRENGGSVSYKTNADGSSSPYELNITYYDLLNSPDSAEPQSLQVQRFLASQAIMLALAGVPGIYLHSLLGSRNYTAGVDNTGRPRAINREKLDLKRVESELSDPGSRRHEVFERYRHLIRERVSHPAFHPNGAQQVLDLHKAVFAIVRVSPDETQTIIALHNVSPSPVEISIAPQQLGVEAEALTDSRLGERVEHDDSGQWVVFLAPYEVRWLTVEQ